jgi:hypothetical protein
LKRSTCGSRADPERSGRHLNRRHFLSSIGYALAGRRGK